MRFLPLHVLDSALFNMSQCFSVFKRGHTLVTSVVLVMVMLSLSPNYSSFSYFNQYPSFLHIFQSFRRKCKHLSSAHEAREEGRQAAVCGRAPDGARQGISIDFIDLLIGHQQVRPKIGEFPQVKGFCTFLSLGLSGSGI